MATSATLAVLNLQAMALALNATHRALSPSPRSQAWLMDQAAVLEKIAAERALESDDAFRQQCEEVELQQMSDDMNQEVIQ